MYGPPPQIGRSAGQVACGAGGRGWAVLGGFGDVERFRITGLGEVFSDVTGRVTVDWELLV